MTDYKLVPVIPTMEMAFAGIEVYGLEDCADADVHAVWEAMIATVPTMQGEPVGWQFYQDGKWWHGYDRIKNHRKNTEEAGFPVRDLYATPQPVVAVPEIIEAVANFVGSQKGGPFTPEVIKAAIIGQLKYGDAFTKLFTSPAPPYSQQSKETYPDVSALVEALEEISDPIRFMNERLEEGKRLNGMAVVTLANAAWYLRSIATAALTTYRKGEEV